MAIGRVVTYAHEIYTVLMQDGNELLTELSGRLRHSGDAWPAVGDWVQVRGEIAIDEVLPRRSSISRKQAGGRTEEQVLAANVDVVFVVSGLDRDFNVRRIERYLVLVRESGARAVLVLNKADLIEDRKAVYIPGGTPVEFTSAALGDVNALRKHVQPGETAILLGSSGVGKSTIVNALLGDTVQKTNGVRDHDSRGRHTTTQRQLIATPDGWFLIDTPGLREVQLWADPDSVEAAFEDISSLAADCRYRDCTHSGEPGCAVVEAIESGALDASRLESFVKLRREAAFLERKVDDRARIAHQQYWKRIHKAIRKHPKLNR